jgi:hypothetical protein
MFGFPDTCDGMETGRYGSREGRFIRLVPVSFGFNHVMSTAEAHGYSTRAIVLKVRVQ